MFRGLFFIVLINNICTSSCAIEALYEAGQQVWKLYAMIDSRRLDISHNANTTESLSDHPIILEMEEQVDKIHEQLDQLEKLMGPKIIRDAIKSWSLGALKIRDIDTMELFIQSIDEYYENFNRYRSQSYHSDDSFEVLMRRIFLTIEGHIRIIRKFTTNAEESPSIEQNLVAVITGYAIIHRTEICGTPEVIPNILIQLFQMIIIAELKASTMLAYENIYGYIQNRSKKERQRFNLLARDDLEKQFANYINTFSLYMTVIEGIYNRACDPPCGNWIRGESFYELEKTFQAIVFGYKLNKCESQSCNHIWLHKPKQCRPVFHEKTVLTRPGDGIAECVFLNQIIACALNSGPYRFQYVNSSVLGFLGRNSSCPMDNGLLVSSGIEGGDNYAACACNSYSSHNKISLFMIESDVDSNRVITGLRFVRKNEVLYIQPREGTLELNGYINQYSQRWIPIPGNIQPSQIEPINRENRVFFLDDLILPINYVLTGVKFNKVTRGNVSGFAIEILGTHFNYRTGRFSLLGNVKRLLKISKEASGKSLSFTPVSPVFTSLPHSVTPSDTEYVSLERSELKEDFGQSTLPLFDAVPITFKLPSALGGVGIFHKGVEGYSGLISLRVYGINYKEHFNDFKLFHIINGLRFVRQNKVLYIQPREGTLEPNGYINQYSQKWIPIPRNINSSLTEPINKENRVFFLDDLTLPADYVLTGIKFNKVTRGNVSGFAIEIFGTCFDYTTGHLELGKDSEQSRKGSNENSGKILSFKAVSSVFTGLRHTVTPSDTKYVSLSRSTLREDFGQSTLPLFDAVPITINVPTALGGVGIFHKGVEGYAGLISLRVYGIKYEKYFNDFKLFHVINDRVLFNSSIH